KALEELFGQANFIIISLGRLHRQLEGDCVKASGGGRVREQNIFERRRLKNSVVRKVHHEATRREITRNRETRIDCAAVQVELIVVPTKAGIYRPIAQAD